MGFEPMTSAVTGQHSNQAKLTHHTPFINSILIIFILQSDVTNVVLIVLSDTTIIITLVT